MTPLTDHEAEALEVIARAMCETMGDDPDALDGHGWEGYATHAYNALAALEQAGFFFQPEDVH